MIRNTVLLLSPRSFFLNPKSGLNQWKWKREQAYINRVFFRCAQWIELWKFEFNRESLRWITHLDAVGPLPALILAEKSAIALGEIGGYEDLHKVVTVTDRDAVTGDPATRDFWYTIDGELSWKIKFTARLVYDRCVFRTHSPFAPNASEPTTTSRAGKLPMPDRIDQIRYSIKYKVYSLGERNEWDCDCDWA